MDDYLSKMNCYISIGYQNRKSLSPEVDAIKETLIHFAIVPFVFVDNYEFSPKDEGEMMNKALEHIDNSEFFIAEVSEKAIGVGVEAGYAKARGIPVIYMRKERSEHSTTVAGISDYQVIYSSIEDLRQKLTTAIENCV